MQKPILKTACLFLLFSTSMVVLSAQQHSFWEPADSLNPKRFWLVTGSGALAYSAASIGLYQAWYKDYPISGFRFFNDWGEWENVDKAGHLFTAYVESYLAYKGARWTGIDQNKAVWIGAGVGTLLQGTVEIMDGFSDRWGFSVHDFAFNTAGVALFAGQEWLWHDQRILIKVSSTRPDYSDVLITNPRTGYQASVRTIAYDIYGSNPFEAFIKDYNGMTVWASVNPSSFFRKKKRNSRFPGWLNISVGYGANDIYGAYYNAWVSPDGGNINLEKSHPRYQQYYLSLDIDPARIPTKSHFLKTLFTAVRWIKIPAPTLEYTSRGDWIFHPIYW